MLEERQICSSHTSCRRGFFLAVFILACVNLCGAAEPSGAPRFLSWSSTAPMGWNSWDCYGPTVTEAEVRANADFMAEKLQRHGWQYVVVDIRWYVENDKAGGYNQRDPRLTMDEHGRFWPA